jgi:hypothetical protein
MSDQKRVLTCVYCGTEYPQDTPASGAQILTDHIKVCERHPMRKLRKALADLVGASTAQELDAMELGMRSIPAPDADKIAAINAIHALRETL